MRRAPEQAVRLLSQQTAHPVLREFVRELYRDWTMRTAKEYLHLSAAARETAFAVAVEQLAREAQAGKLDAATFAQRAHAEVLSALRRQKDQDEQPRFATRCRKWIPVEVAGVPTSPAELEELVWRAALGERSPAIDDALRAFENTWRRCATRSFGSLDRESREEGVNDALVRLTTPITAACLTPDNLSRRCRGIARGALTNAYDKMHPERVFLDISEENDGPQDDETAEERIKRRFGERVWDELLETLERVLPWTGPVLRRQKTLKDVAREEGVSYGALRKQSSRAHRFLRGIAEVLERIGYSKRGSEEVKKGIEEVYRAERPTPELFRQIAATIKRLAESDLARSILPVAVVDALRRIAARLANPWGSDGSPS